MLTGGDFQTEALDIAGVLQKKPVQSINMCAGKFLKMKKVVIHHHQIMDQWKGGTWILWRVL